MNPIVLNLVLTGAGPVRAGLLGVIGASGQMNQAIGAGSINSVNGLKNLSVAARSIEYAFTNGAGRSSRALLGIGAAASQAAQKVSAARALAIQRLGGEDNARSIQQTGGAVAMGGGVAIGVGVGLGAIAMQSVRAADEMQGYRNSLKRLYGEQGADEELAKITQFSKATPYDIRGSFQAYTMLASTGVKREDIIPALNALGGAAAAVNGGNELVSRLAVNLGHIQNQVHPNQRNLNQFAFAGVNIRKVIGAATGKEETMDSLKQMSGTEFVQNFIKGANKSTAEGGFGGAIEARMNTLSGQLSMLSENFFLLSASIGQYLLPVVRFAVSVFATLVGWFMKLPEPIKAVIAYGLGFGSVLLIVGGALALVGGLLMMNAVNFLTLAGMEITVAGATTTLGAALTTTLLPALGGFLTVIGSIALVALAAAAAMWALDKILHRSEDRALAENIKKGDEADRKFYDTISEKSGGHRPGESFEDWKRRTGRGAENSDDADSDPTAKAQSDIADLMKKGATPAGTAGAMPGVLPGYGMAGISPEMMSGLTGMSADTSESMAGAQNQIEALQDQIAATTDKDTRKALSNQLRLANRAKRHGREAEAAQNKAESAQAKRVREDMYLNRTRATNPSDQAALDAAIAREAIHDAPAAAKRAAAQAKRQAAEAKRKEAQAQRDRADQRRLQLAEELAPLQDLAANPNASKAQKAAAREQMRLLRRDYQFANMGLEGAPNGLHAAPLGKTLSALSSLNPLDAFRGGSIFSGSNPLAAMGQGGGDTATLGGTSATSGISRQMTANLVSQRDAGLGRVEVTFRGFLNDGGLSNQLAEVL